jgi:hypothetical protein
VPSRTSQDKRDAIAAALTACDYEHDRFDAFGDIVVPPPCSSRALASFAHCATRGENAPMEAAGRGSVATLLLSSGAVASLALVRAAYCEADVPS